jgi:hypothetical protein
MLAMLGLGADTAHDKHGALAASSRVSLPDMQNNAM